MGSEMCIRDSIRGGVVRQVTVDHSLVQLMVERGRMTAEEARTHPYRNVVTRAVGNDTFAGADIFRQDIMSGDILLLCSDGLSNYLKNDDFLDCISGESDLGEMAAKMVGIALERGGSDNITVALAQAFGGDADGR